MAQMLLNIESTLRIGRQILGKSGENPWESEKTVAFSQTFRYNKNIEFLRGVPYVFRCFLQSV